MIKKQKPRNDVLGWLGFFALFTLLAFVFVNYLGFGLGETLKAVFIDRSLTDEIITAIAMSGILKIVLTFVLFFIFSFGIGSAIIAWKYVFIRDMVYSKKKASLKRVWLKKNRYVISIHRY